MDWLLRQRVSVFILETGTNDMLRGQDVEATRANVDAILARAHRPMPPPRLVLLGMRAAPNLGAEYVRPFSSIYPDATRKHAAVLVPFVLGSGRYPAAEPGRRDPSDGRGAEGHRGYRVAYPRAPAAFIGTPFSATTA